ncbi:hypothetical protein HS088_TW17G00533 [Tripterygium wilfordii]|uniref:DUF4378 domain-containing protein n=1 Tax=Tripterygium wilfordii TaxID=458696 RepID=A0A7J7CFT6_TRIWF|nr:uncharacterized protein LOC119983151 [Tripterygium wilfordii]KAF5732999.1 hypothetical protein HS088_TW17G00533 [Tripterygium wilfordii]
MCPNTTMPRMLKDYLLEDLNSCSSTGFKSFPRNPPLSDYAARRPRPSRIPSTKAASTTISAFQAMINAVKKNIQFLKSPSVILPRSLSRTLSRRNSTKNKNREHNLNVRQVKITVKDIMRWTSFRDINVVNHSEPFESAPSPDHHCTNTTISTTTTTTTTSSCTCSSSGSSWCDSDFTEEDLQSWGGNCEEDVGENDVADKPVVPNNCEDVNTVEPKGEAPCEEERHEQSPISVLHHEFEEDEESLSSLDQSLVNIERTKEKLMQKIRRFESLAKVDPVNLEKWMSMDEETNSSTDIEQEEEEEEEQEELRDEEIEEKNTVTAWHLLEQVKTTTSLDTVEQLVLLDFFRDELGADTNDQIGHPGLENETLTRKARVWLRGEHSTLLDLGVDDNDEQERREALVNDLYMEGRRRRWSSSGFEEEGNELAMEVENGLLGDLVDQLLLEILL